MKENEEKEEISLLRENIIDKIEDKAKSLEIDEEKDVEYVAVE